MGVGPVGVETGVDVGVNVGIGHGVKSGLSKGLVSDETMNVSESLHATPSIVA